MNRFGIQPGDAFGRYRVIEEAGRGGMATVLKVEDTRDGAIRALKILMPSSQDQEARSRFDAEFEVLSKLSHPNITQVFEAGSHDSHAFFVMEMVDGHDLREELAVWKVLPHLERFQKVELVLEQLVKALSYVHDRGLVHRDVTPGNIMVTRNGEVKLMDFGVVKTPGAELTAVGEMVGTVAYMAPEQIRGDPVDARTDLYSLGTVLYLMLTGRRPFNARTLAGYLDKHLNLLPRPPRDVEPFVPTHLNDVCMRLLAKDPAERFGSANHLLNVLDLRQAGLEEINLKNWPPRLVGRQREQAALREAVISLSAGRGGVVLLEGKTGYGKGRLLSEALIRAEEQAIPVARGNCYKDREYSGFHGVFQELVPKDVSVPAVLESTFRHGESQGPIEPYAVHVAFRELLSGMLPRIVIIDNVQSADRGTMEMLLYLLRNCRELKKEPILFLLGRLPHFEDNDFLGHLVDDESKGVECLYLSPLGATDVEELLSQLIKDSESSRRLARRLHREGEGNPYFIAEMIRGLVEEGIIFKDESGQYRLSIGLEEITRTNLPLPTNIREALRERIEPLSGRAKHIACMVALCRQETSIELLLEALARSEDQVMDCIEELVDAGVLRQRSVGSEEFFELARPRLQDLLVEDLPPRERARMHRQLGTAMEKLYRHRLTAVLAPLSRHFELGHVPAKAYPYMIRAGQRLCDRAFMPEALEFFIRALALEAEARDFMVLDEADRRLVDLLLLHGQVLEHMGQWREAGSALERADRLARQLDGARLQSRTAEALGNFYRRNLRIEDALTHLTEALLLADQVSDQRLRVAPLYGLGSIYWSQERLEDARQHYLNSLTVAGAIDDERYLGMGYNGLGLVAICRGQSTEARKYLEQAAQIMERVGLLGNLSITRVNLVELSHCTGNLRKGLQLADKTVANAREVSHPLGVALGLRYRAIILTDLGRFSEAMENASEAIRLCQELGDPEDELGALVASVRVPLAQRKFLEALPIIERCKPLLEEYDVEGYGPLLWAWQGLCLAEQGKPEEALAALTEADNAPSRSWPHQQVRFHLVRGRVLAEAGRRADALEEIELALRGADSAGYRLYSLKAHQLIASISESKAVVSLHSRIASNLSRSLAANLSRDDAKVFLSLYDSLGKTNEVD
jgi:tetratricopeptide (TPR) repeat protein